MASPKLTLYADAKFTSPYAMSAFVTLREKGLPFEIRTLDLAAGENHATGYAKLSLTRRVPTLVDGDFTLSESSAISEYLEERFPAPQYPAVYPADVRVRARARQVQAWIRSDFMPIRMERSTEWVFIKPTTKPLSPEAKASAEKLFAIADALVPADAGNLFGNWCIADTDLAMMLNRLAINGDAVPGKLADYAQRQWERPSVQLWVGQDRGTA
jgi:glutathione S-transferase